jgi:hypothetical protein
MWPSPHWRRWLGVESRCVVPFTSFSENEVLPNGSWPPIWFALSEVDNTGMKVSENGAFVAGRISMASDYDHQHQLTLWQEKVRLDEGFLKSLREHPVPVREEAISAIGTRSLPIDIYIWLAYRLHVLTKPTPISWLSLHSQFGAGFKTVRQFKPTMTDALSMALAVYPEAEVSISQDGVTLFPSPPAIPKAEARRLGIL